MPKPIPPPPPQPSSQQTVGAVRLARGLILAALAAFGLMALPIHAQGPVVDYGRETGLEWNLWAIERLDEQALRQDRPLAWLVGSSVLRDAIDEDALNAQLEPHGRVAMKFGVERGAAGIAAGLLERLPVREGDVVVHTISVDNFRPDWLDFNKVPAHFVSATHSPAQLWAIDEYAFAEKADASVGFLPREFWTWRDAHRIGLTNWGFTLIDGPPRRTRPKQHLTHRKLEKHAKFRRGFLSPKRVAHARLEAADFQPVPGQVNAEGLRRIRAFCDQQGATLVLVNIPRSQLADDHLTSPEVAQAWDAFKQEQGVITFDRPPDDHFYDDRHSNSAGRAWHTPRMAQLLLDLD